MGAQCMNGVSMIPKQEPLIVFVYEDEVGKKITLSFPGHATVPYFLNEVKAFMSAVGYSINPSAELEFTNDEC